MPSVMAAGRRVAPGGKWGREEDMKLRAIVEKHGAKNWRHIAELLGTTRTDVQWYACLYRGCSGF